MPATTVEVEQSAVRAVGQAARPSFNDSGFKNGQQVMVVWTKIINLCALIVYSLGIFSIITRATTEYLVIKL